MRDLFFTLKHISDLHKPYILTGNSGFTVIQYDGQPDRKISIGSKKIVTRYFLKEFLLNTPVDDPWILMLQSKMNPQHSLIRAKVNYGNSDIFWVSDGIVPYAMSYGGSLSLSMKMALAKGASMASTSTNTRESGFTNEERDNANFLIRP